jgi:uncharacterized protein (TIGR02246 family)
MLADADTSAILRIIDDYPRAIAEGDADLFASLFWLDDPNLTIIENDRGMPMGREYIDTLVRMVRDRGRQPDNQVWHDTRCFSIAPDVAYTVSLREERNTSQLSRVTLVLVRKSGGWRILHAHFSVMPER